MAALNLPFAASGDRRIPTTPELASGFPCGPADIELFNWLNWWLTGQLSNAILKSGESPDDTDILQFTRLLRAQTMNYKAAAGTANALTATFDPALTPTDGMPIRILPSLSNTGAATFNGDPIVHRNGTPLVRGDIIADMPFSAIYYSGSWFLVGVSYGEILVPLTADTTFYVRTDGNNANTGLTNTAGGAFQTLQGAYDAVRQRYFANGYGITLQIGLTGSYMGLIHSTWPGSITVDGTGVTATITQITGTVQCFTCVSQTLFISNCVITGTAGAGARGVWCSAGVVTAHNCTWNSPGGTYNHVLVENGGSFYITGNHSLAGNCSALLRAVGGSNIYLGNTATAFVGTLPGSPVFSVACVDIFEVSRIMNRGGTWIGGASGPRYLGQVNSALSTNGAGANYFPGNAAGTVSTGAQYV